MLTTDEVRRLSDELTPQLIEVRRDLHQHPELAFQEERTAKFIQTRLAALGVPSHRVAKTGVLGMIRGAHPGPALLLRADMDALPVDEQGDKPYRSATKGVMHACGHDAHVSILLGVAKVLAEHSNQLNGMVKLAFQPAEEHLGGAQPMIEEGVLEDPRVDAAFALHVGSFLPVGTVGLLPRVGMAAADSAVIRVQGKGGHGAMPADSVDATIIASHIVVALQTIISREIPPQGFGVITVGSLHSGTVGNVISGTAEMNLSIRSFDEEYRLFLKQRVQDVAQGVATTFRAAADIDFKMGYPVLINDPQMTERVRIAAEKVIGPRHVQSMAAVTGSEDFSYFLREVPGTFFWVGAGNPARGIDKPHHHPEFDIDERALTVGVQVMLQTVMDYLGAR